MFQDLIEKKRTGGRCKQAFEGWGPSKQKGKEGGRETCSKQFNPSSSCYKIFFIRGMHEVD